MNPLTNKSNSTSPARRIDALGSRTAEMTCLSRACSTQETNPYYHSGDTIAPLLLPDKFQKLLRWQWVRRVFMRLVAPRGMYEYVIARTRYIDAAYEAALEDQVAQILIFGAGFDTRALRFTGNSTRIFELDIPSTQQEKIGQYKNRGLINPANLTYIAIDFDKDSLPAKLQEAGFDAKKRSLFLLEGLIMYLQPDSVDDTFKTIQAWAAPGSRIIFDCVDPSIFDQAGENAEKSGIAKRVKAAGEQWYFGLGRSQAEAFLSKYSMRLVEFKGSTELENAYFTRPDGMKVASVNPTHTLFCAEKS